MIIYEFNIKKITFVVTKERFKLNFNAGEIAHFSFTYEKVNKTDSLQQSCCNRPLV